MAERGDISLLRKDGGEEDKLPPPSPWVRRYVWTSRLDYILTLIGYTVGLGSIWRFPYVCHRNGGGAFLIPYVLFMMTVAIPLFFLEVVIGQFSKRGPIGAWGLCPLMKGIGIGQVMLSALIVPYYTLVLAWSLFYLYKSFSPVLPWTVCDVSNTSVTCLAQSDVTSELVSNFRFVRGETNTTTISAAEKYWRGEVLGMSSNLEDVGSMQSHLVITLVIACVITFLCVIKGMRVVGKIVYVTALLPYFLLSVLFVRSCMMPGAVDGLLFFITPDFARLADYKVWCEALVQVFFSVGPAFGAIITISSHNHHSNNPACDALIVTIVGPVTSILAGLVVFATLGFVSREVNAPIEHAISAGPGLAFIVYPAAVALLPVPQLWSILLFLMLFMLGIDSTLGCLETVVVASEDHLSRFFPLKKHIHAIMAAVFMIIVLGVGLPFTMSNGLFVYELLDNFIPLLAPMVIAALECIVISWMYGIRRFSVDIEYMIGRQPPVIFKMFCCIFTPALLIIVIVLQLMENKPLKFESYEYPFYANVIGWSIAILPLLPIPVAMVIQVFKRRGSCAKKFHGALKPDSMWDKLTQTYRANEYDMWQNEKTSVCENAKFIFVRETID